jgi:hypothetical protein
MIDILFFFLPNLLGMLRKFFFINVLQLVGAVCEAMAQKLTPLSHPSMLACLQFRELALTGGCPRFPLSYPNSDPHSRITSHSLEYTTSQTSNTFRQKLNTDTSVRARYALLAMKENVFPVLETLVRGRGEAGITALRVCGIIAQAIDQTLWDGLGFLVQQDIVQMHMSHSATIDETTAFARVLSQLISHGPIFSHFKQICSTDLIDAIALRLMHAGEKHITDEHVVAMRRSLLSFISSVLHHYTKDGANTLCPGDHSTLLIRVALVAHLEFEFLRVVVNRLHRIAFLSECLSILMSFFQVSAMEPNYIYI